MVELENTNWEPSGERGELYMHSTANSSKYTAQGANYILFWQGNDKFTSSFAAGMVLDSILHNSLKYQSLKSGTTILSLVYARLQVGAHLA